MRVATFNMRHAVGIDSILDLERSAAVVGDTGADLIGLQELDRGVRRSGGVDQPGQIAQLTGMDVRFHRTVRTGGGEYGIAVATRAPVEDRFVALPRAGTEEPRGAIVVRHEALDVVVAHVSNSTPAQGLQLIALAELVRDLGPRVVLLGDLNVARHNLGPLVAAGLDPGPEHTTMAQRPGVQIDYVLTGSAVRVRDSWTVELAASDHLALVADLAID